MGVLVAGQASRGTMVHRSLWPYERSWRRHSADEYTNQAVETPDFPRKNKRRSTRSAFCVVGR
jgi:hypothetical protein